MALRFHEVPIRLTPEQIQTYLYEAITLSPTPSNSFFKLTVYALRFSFRVFGMDARMVELPKIAREKKLPVVLNRSEVRRILDLCTNRKHRLMIELLYGCGLRNSELRNLQSGDLDFERKTVHVRGGKGRKDRYVVMGDRLSRSLAQYSLDKTDTRYFFSSRLGLKRADGQYSGKGLNWIIVQAASRAGITKKVSVHTLRHTYATHLLDNGLDILSIGRLLGHADINHTLIYLHVSQLGRQAPFSPLDRLLGDNLPAARCPLLNQCA